MPFIIAFHHCPPVTYAPRPAVLEHLVAIGRYDDGVSLLLTVPIQRQPVRWAARQLVVTPEIEFILQRRVHDFRSGWSLVDRWRTCLARYERSHDGGVSMTVACQMRLART